MSQQPLPRGGLALLAEAFRSKRTGELVFGSADATLRVRLELGQIVALGPAPGEATAATPLPKPNDSVWLRLERVLSEIGMRKPAADADPTPASPPSTLRDQLIERLADDSQQVHFEAGGETPRDLVAVAVATEPLILEAVRQMRHDDAVRAALGDLDQQLVATTALADERTLTLTEGYLLSRIDGLLSARQVLQIVPLDARETERSLLGLMLTGRVVCRPAPARPAGAPRAAAEAVEPTVTEAEPIAEPIAEPMAEPMAEPVAEPVAQPAADPLAVEQAPAADAVLTPAVRFTAPPEPEAEDDVVDARDEPIVEAIPDDELSAGDAASAPPLAPPAPAPDPATMARRREILEYFQSLPLKNHFEVLAVEPGCTDADVRRAYVALVKRFHPDSQRDRRLEDLHDILEAITIRVGEAWEVLGEAKSRASYESRAGISRRTSTRPEASAGPKASAVPPAAAPDEPDEYVAPEEVLFKARRLLAQARYWDAIQMLESALPRMEPTSQQHRGRLLLARAYSKNPNWLRRAEEMLQELMREDPTNADVHYELGLLYKTGGFVARAQSMFRRALELRPGHKEASAELGVQTDAAEGGGLLKRLFKRGKAS